MKSTEAIEQLKELIGDRNSFMVGDYEEYYEKDVEALEYVIESIKELSLIKSARRIEEGILREGKVFKIAECNNCELNIHIPEAEYCVNCGEKLNNENSKIETKIPYKTDVKFKEVELKDIPTEELIDELMMREEIEFIAKG